MDARYVNIGLPEDKVIEECAEVIQAITKIKRFGLMNYHPERTESNNKMEVFAEMKDLRVALDRYEEYLTTAST